MYNQGDHHFVIAYNAEAASPFEDCSKTAQLQTSPAMAVIWHTEEQNSLIDHQADIFTIDNIQSSKYRVGIFANLKHT